MILGALVVLYVLVQRPVGASPVASIAPSFAVNASNAAAVATTTVAAAPTAPPTPAPTPSPVVIRGTGQTATQPFTLPGRISIAHFTHNGRSNFIVEAFGGTSGLLINTIGAYDGSRPLVATSPVQLNIEADGAWTVTIAAIECCAASGEFVGTGDTVSNQFNAPASGAWEFSNVGRSNYVVYARCAGGDQLVQNRIGSFQGSAIVVFGRGPCYWEVISDGSWTIRPR